MKMKKQCSGFTIIELMVSMVAMAILSLAVGTMLVSGWTGWRRNTESVGMQRDAVFAMNVIAREIRNSNISEITSTDEVGIYFGAGTVRSNPASFLASEIAYTGGVNVRDFSVTQNDTGILTNVTVAFTLFTASGTDQNNYAMTITPRN
jgi:prepilin-type N-terminal cleavage/methylation domain-containing protein